MKVAIMQPYFFPYIGYFQLIHAVDTFILFDDVQYIRHGWINRNRILKPELGHQYIIAPLAKHQQKSLIKEISVLEGVAWKEKILRQIEHYKKKAPFYNQVKNLLEDCFDFNEQTITAINAHYLKKVCSYIDIDTPLQISSGLKLDYDAVREKGDWALEISSQMKAEEYINPIGGEELFDKEGFIERQIKLSFLQTISIQYDQGRLFETNLSIIDVMMFNSPDQIRSMLNDFELK